MIKPSGTVTAWRALTRMGLGLLGGLLLLPQLTLAAPLWSERLATDETIPALQQLNASLVTLTQKLLPAVVSLKVHTKKDADTALPKNHPTYTRRRDAVHDREWLHHSCGWPGADQQSCDRGEHEH